MRPQYVRSNGSGNIYKWEQHCLPSIQEAVVVINKEKWDRLVELIGYLKHAASEAGVTTKGDEVGDIIEEVGK